MKNLVSIFAGHDANVSFYDAKAVSYTHLTLPTIQPV